MKDRLLLMGAGVVCSLLAWLFWRMAGQWGFPVLAMSAILGGNLRLRRRIRELQGPPEATSSGK